MINREYNLNKLTMNPLRFMLYRFGLFIKSVSNYLSEKREYRGDNYYFETGWSGFDLCYQESGYDSRSSLQIYIIWGKLFLKFGKRKEYIESEYDGSESKRWGIGYYSDDPSIYLRYGNKFDFIHLPWSYDWIRTSNLRSDGEWEHETLGNHKEFYDDKWKNILFKESYDYRYVLNSGKIQNVTATIKVVEREWRMRGLKWTKLNNLVRKSIDVNFSNEIGERSGSYKGGVCGTGYEMKGNETPLETLRRMERDYKC